MKTIIVGFLAVISMAQGFSVPSFLSSISQELPSIPKTNITALLGEDFPEIRHMNASQKLQHFLKNCPHFKVPLETIIQNLEASMQRANMTGTEKTHQDGFTCHAGLSKEDFQKQFLNLKPSQEALNRDTGVASPSRRKRATAVAAPASFDWRTKGAVSVVQDQKQCGSCWTFSANGAMEGVIFNKTGKLPNLSEQNLVDCVTASGGCNGGWMTDAYEYANTNQGVDSETSYPYTATNGSCKYLASGNAGKVTSYKYTVANDEIDLMNKVYSIGPIAAAIDASIGFQTYKSGVVSCPKYAGINHGVLIVGYGTDSSLGDYWIVKNSWGTSWGEQGYVRIARNKGTALGCGLAGNANYPIY